MYQLFANKSIFISKYREQFVAKCWQDRAAMKEKMGLEGKEEQDEGGAPRPYVGRVSELRQ